ncbi:hypothetical protein J3459_013746 [Metarhizium acridum]|nr:hypothetical protein J3459_013746 [Metarhizium acridum]
MLSFLGAISQMAATHGHYAAAPQQKLKLIKSPLVMSDDKFPDEPNLSAFGDRYRDDAPEFQRVRIRRLSHVWGHFGPGASRGHKKEEKRKEIC